MSDCKPTPEVTVILRQMAKSLVEAGHTDPMDVVDRIHAEIQDHTPMWKSEIADAVSGYAGGGRKRTASEIQLRVNQLKKELKEAFHPKDKYATQNKTRQTDLKNQIAALQDKLKSKDYSKPERSKPVYDAETQKLEKERDQLKRKVDKEIRLLEYNNQSKTAKVVDTAFAFMRASILSGIHTIGKLTSAALSRVVLTTPAEEAIGAGLRHIPYISDIAAKAPREGKGSLGAEGQALSHTFSKNTLKEMKDTALTASGALDAMYGKDKYGMHKWLDIVGQIHGALKAPAKINEFTRSVYLRSQHAREQLIKEGKTPAEVDEIMQSAPAQAIITANAYKDGQRAIFMSDNQAVTAYKALVGVMKHQKPGSSSAFFGNVGTRTLEYLLPIVKVPTNVVAEAGSYSLGAVKAIVQLAAAGGKEKLTPDQADYIMRNLKKQTLGAALMSVGYLVPSAVGGYYRGGTQYKDADEPAEGSLKLFGHEIPKMLLHTPAFEMLQIGATIRKMMDAGKGPVEGVYAGAQGLLGQVPFFDTPKRLVGAFRDTKSLGNYVDREIASRLVPAIVNDVATATDKEAVPRKATTLDEAIKLRLPIARETVAPVDYKKVKGATAKLAVYEKATDEQKKQFYDDITKSIKHSKSLTQKQKDAYQDRVDAAYPQEKK